MINRSFILSFFLVSLALSLVRISHFLSPIDLSVAIFSQLASAVGVSLKVPENEYNQLAERLKKKEQELNEREHIISNSSFQVTGGSVIKILLKDPPLVILLGVNMLLLFALVFHLSSDRRHMRAPHGAVRSSFS